jgi:hypothetical protein
VAIVEIIWYTLELLILLGIILSFAVAGVVVANNKREQEKNGDSEANSNWGLIAFGAIVLAIIGFLICLMSVISIVFGVILLKGSNNRHLGKCKAWLIFRGIMLFLAFFSLLLGGNIFGLWEIFVTPYFMWVTYAYMQELKDEYPQGQGVVYSQPQQHQEKV